MKKILLLMLMLLLPIVSAENTTCGNDMCQKGESPATCYADCKFNIDEITCVLRDNQCNSWVYWFYLIILGGIIWYRSRR